MSELNITLNEILEDKNANLLPQNLKAGVTCLGVNGALEGGNVGVKLFETQEQMQTDTTAQEGDKAIVYRSEIVNGTATTEFTQINFADTVVLPSAVTSSLYCMLRNDSGMSDGQISLNASSCDFTGYGSSMIRVRYTSTDGITYTKTEGDNIITFDNPIKCYNESQWNDNFGYFLRTGGNVFEGLYSCEQVNNENAIVCHKLISTENRDMVFEQHTINIDKLIKIYDKLIADYNVTNYVLPLVVFDGIDENKEPINPIGYVVNRTHSENSFYPNEPAAHLALLNDNSLVVTGPWSDEGFSSDTAYGSKIIFDLENETYTTETKAMTKIKDSDVASRKWFKLYDLTDTQKYFTQILKRPDKIETQQVSYYIENDTGITDSFLRLDCPYELVLKYILANIQLTAQANEVWGGKVFYGKNGVETGTLGIDVSLLPNDKNAELVAIIQSKYDEAEPLQINDKNEIPKDIYYIPTKSTGEPLLDTSNMTSGNLLFASNENLKKVPLIDTSNMTDTSSMFYSCTELEEVANIDTSKVTNMASMFRGCSNLKAVPEIDTSKVTNMEFAFYNIGAETLPLLDTSEVTTMKYTFGNANLTTIPLINTSKVKDATGMFQYSKTLTTIPLIDLSNATSAKEIFKGCTALTSVPALDFSGVTDAQYLFYGCTSLVDVGEINVSNATNIYNIFRECSSLVTAPAMNTAKCTDMSNMFMSCTSLVNVPVYDTANATRIWYSYSNCPNLSDASLNNILLMCKNATKVAASSKTLKMMGLTEEQANKCKTLSNWSAYAAAGGTTGY